MSKTRTQTLRAVRVVDDQLVEHPALLSLFPDEALRRSLAKAARTALLPGGHTLFADGDPGDNLYVVLSGRLQTFVVRRGKEVVETEIGVGELCGERAIVSGGARTASARAVRDTQLLELSREAFDHLLLDHPQALMQLARAMAQRLEQASKEHDPRGVVRTVALVPLHGVRLDSFRAWLVEALCVYGDLLVLDRSGLEQALGDGAADTTFSGEETIRLANWLADQESRHRFVMYLADAELTDWTRRCIRQSDRVVLVADPSDSPRIGPIEDYLLDPGDSVHRAGRELVLLGRTAAAPWLQPRDILKHHFVRGPADAARMARGLAGHSVGLVLSGGGARSLAHLGAIRALREAGMPIDAVGGTSGGAFVGGLLAMGWDDDAMQAAAREALLGSGRLLDLSLPVFGLIAGTKFRSVLMGLYGEQNIEDLPLPFFCASTNLTEGRLHIHRSGVLWRWVRASMSVPGLSPPLIERGVIHVDGSVLNNLPLDVMRDQGAGHVVGINVGSAEGPRADESISNVPPPWKAFKDKLRRKEAGPKVPGIVDVLLAATLIGGVRQSAGYAALADLLISPDVGEFGLLDFSSFDAIVEAGYRETVAAIEAAGGLPER